MSAMLCRLPATPRGQLRETVQLAVSHQIAIVVPRARQSSFGEHDGLSLSFDREALTSGRRSECPAMSVKNGRTTTPGGTGGMTPAGAGIGGTTISMMRGAGVTIDAHPPSTAAKILATIQANRSFYDRDSSIKLLR